MNDNGVAVDSGHHQKVIERPAVGHEDDDRASLLQLLVQQIERAVHAQRAPPALLDRVDQDRVRNADDPAGTLLDERRERRHIGMGVAPIPEDHGGRRASAEGLRLRQIRNRKRERGDQRGQHGANRWRRRGGSR